VTEVLQWIDPAGVTTTLDVEWEVKGRFMPKIESKFDEVPGQSGGIPRDTRHGIREFVVVVWQAAGSEAALRTALRSFVRTMDPVRGSGTLRVTSPVGDQREIVCQYATGLDLDETLGDNSGPDFQKIPLGFIAHDPYWYAVSPVAETFTLGTPAVFFPVFPAYFSPSSIIASDTVINDGDLEAWPVWTITGPGAEIRLTNTTTGEFIYLEDNTLGVGEALTIDTRFTKKTLTLQDGTSVFDWLSLDSTLWAIEPGTTEISLAMTNSTASSGLTVSYYSRYLSP
jgi:hypothetical protein